MKQGEAMEVREREAADVSSSSSLDSAPVPARQRVARTVGGLAVAVLGVTLALSWLLAAGVGCQEKDRAQLDGGAGARDLALGSCDAGAHAWRTLALPPAVIADDRGDAFNLFDIWGASGAAVWAVGTGGTVLFFDGTSWVRQTSPTVEQLTSVWGTGPEDVWACGLHGTVLHYDGHEWADRSPPDALFAEGDAGVLPPGDAGVARRPSLWGVWATGANGQTDTAVAVGDDGFVAFWEQQKWRRVATGVPEDLFAVWGASPSQVFVVGSFGTALFGSSAGLAKQQTGVARALRGVWGHAADDVYAVGVNGTLLHRSAAGWSAIEGAPRQVLREIWGPANDRSTAYVVGWDGLLMRVQGGPSFSRGAAIDLIGCVTRHRLEGVWGTLVDASVPDGGVPDAGLAPVPRAWAVGVSGTLIVGP
ncbi:MAG: hypothetical protein IPL40_15335 [Proteobacteria bacterium]|nr:hypothetical protein [Pseudomonadota bacterium]